LVANQLNHVPWIFVNGIRANLADVDLLQKLKAAGLRRTAFGVETGDPDMIVRIDKHIDHDTIRQAFKNAKQVGIETIGFFIIGLPGDTRESMQRTIDFAIEVDPMIANFSMMTPYPGTKVYEEVKRNGQLLMKDWEDYVFFDTIEGRVQNMGPSTDISVQLVADFYEVENGPVVNSQTFTVSSEIGPQKATKFSFSFSRDGKAKYVRISFRNVRLQS
jgi:radical SAM superfamily enzyme YgiQ (UPF0313 family)